MFDRDGIEFWGPQLEVLGVRYGGGKRETIPHSSGIQDLSFRHPYGTEFDHAMWGVTCVMQRTLCQGSWDALGMA